MREGINSKIIKKRKPIKINNLNDKNKEKIKR